MPVSTSRQKPRLIVELGDTHCGSSQGLLRPGFVTIEGNEVKLNPTQDWLWDSFEDATKRWLPKICGSDPFLLVLKGDLVDNIHHGTTQVISNDFADHIEAANWTLTEIVKEADRSFCIEGTEIHTKTAEHKLAKGWGCEKDPETGKYAWPRLSLTMNGVRSVFQHHISATTREYLRGSMLSIFLGNEQIAAAQAGEEIPRVLSCAHRHGFDLYQNATSLCVVSHCWQALTRYGYRVVPAARTKPGLVVHDYRDKKPGELPYIHHISYSRSMEKGASA